MKYYLNGHLLWSGTDTALTSGRVGMGIYKDSSSTGNLFLGTTAILSTIVTTDTADMKETVEKSGEESTGGPTQTSCRRNSNLIISRTTFECRRFISAMEEAACQRRWSCSNLHVYFSCDLERMFIHRDEINKTKSKER
jgi:hypothetical protein